MGVDQFVGEDDFKCSLDSNSYSGYTFLSKKKESQIMKMFYRKLLVFLVLIAYLIFTNLIYHYWNILVRTSWDLIMELIGCIFVSFFLFFFFKILYKTKPFRENKSNLDSWKRYGRIGAYLGAILSIVYFVVGIFVPENPYNGSSNAIICTSYAMYHVNAD